MVGFQHIHCSSRFDRSPESLESDLDDWKNESSIITLTEVQSNARRAKLREPGWGYYNSVQGAQRDNCAVMWKKELWREQAHWIRKLYGRWMGESHPLAGCYSCSVLLRRAGTGHTMLVTVAHLPAHVQGYGGMHWRHADQFWEQRKRAYQESNRSWSMHVKDLVRRRRPDAVMVVADWNLNMKDDWVRDYLRDRWGQEYHHAWKQFPTAGGSFSGSAKVPLGAPGKSRGSKIIDGTMYRGLKVTLPPNLMHATRSSDHRPYKEGFEFQGKHERDDDDQVSGDRQRGDAWWGFGDYLDDDIYYIDRQFES